MNTSDIVRPGRQPTSRDGQVAALWLTIVVAMIFLVFLVGGGTRLADAGLSITEWAPFMGIIPPFSSEQWSTAFSQYQLTAEYELVNSGMSMVEFRTIFWWEWAHRFIARLVAFTFFIPLIVLLWRRQVSSRVFGWLGAATLLGLVQAGVGWWMVLSGLSGRVDVSHIRLAVHYGFAIGITACLVVAINRLRSVTASLFLAKKTLWLALGLVVLVFTQSILGSFVAGMDAGLIYPTWPWMGDTWMPAEISTLGLSPREWINDRAGVQFLHRSVAIVLLVYTFAYRFFAVPRGGRSEVQIRWLLGLICIQFLIGIATLVLQVPFSMAWAHQGLAFLVFVGAIWHVATLSANKYPSVDRFSMKL